MCFSSWSYHAFGMLTDHAPIVTARDSVLIYIKSEPFAQSLKMALEANGHRSTAVTTESLALTEAKEKVPSLIMLDFRSGSIATFRRMRELNTVPIIAVQEGSISCTDESTVFKNMIRISI